MKTLLRRLKCLLELCPYKSMSDYTGCWGECIDCGKRAGFVSREELRHYTDVKVERLIQGSKK